MSTPSLITSTTLGKTDVKVGKVAHGLMLMTWKDPVVDDETAFGAIKAGLDLVQPGEKIFLNSGEFYGHNPPEANLDLLSRFFEKYPEYKDRAFVSVKGAVDAEGHLSPDTTYENMRKSALNIAKHLGPVKKLDLFEPARLDGKRTIEEVATDLQKLKEEGLFSQIGLSEIKADTLRRASKVADIAAVEIEISPWSYDQDVKDVIVAAKELGVNVIAYSPLGRGFLTGTIKPEELKPTDFRFHVPRFQGEAATKNEKLVELLSAISAKKGITNAQLCIAWVSSLGDHVIPLPGSSKASRTLENFAAANVVLSEAEKKELDEVIATFVVSGDRYPEFAKGDLMR